MKKEARQLLVKSQNSLIASIELFNRPQNTGRAEGVLIFLDHGFEMLLKASILHKGGKIRAKGERNTYGFKQCINKALGEDEIKFLNENEATVLRLINGLRDACQHYLIEIPEQQLYFCAQSGVTLFSDILMHVFGLDLKSFLPERVLPISAMPPQNLPIFMESESKILNELLSVKKRKTISIKARARSLAIMERATRGDQGLPTSSEIDRLLERLKAKNDWTSIFPGVASLNISVTEGIPIQLRITKTSGTPIRLVNESSPEAKNAPIAVVKRVNELDFYSHNLTTLSKKIGLSMPKTRVLVNHLDLTHDAEYYKEIHMGKTSFKRYSQNAASKISEYMGANDLQKLWEENFKKYRKK